VGHRAGLDRQGKSRPHRDSIPRPSTPKPVTIPTVVSQPTHRVMVAVIRAWCLCNVPLTTNMNCVHFVFLYVHVGLCKTEVKELLKHAHNIYLSI